MPRWVQCAAFAVLVIAGIVALPAAVAADATLLVVEGLGWRPPVSRRVAAGTGLAAGAGCWACALRATDMGGFAAAAQAVVATLDDVIAILTASDTVLAATVQIRSGILPAAFAALHAALLAALAATAAAAGVCRLSLLLLTSAVRSAGMVLQGTLVPAAAVLAAAAVIAQRSRGTAERAES